MEDGEDATLGRLHQLAASFGRPLSKAAQHDLLRIALTVGTPTVPMCLRELASDRPLRRQWARTLLATVAQRHRHRVVRGVRTLLAGAAGDESKVDALGLLADMGESSAPARFVDPRALQRRSVAHLAEHLGSPAEVAAAADLLVSQLLPDDLFDVVEALVESQPDKAPLLIAELLAHVELDAGTRSELRRISAPLTLARPKGAARSRKPTFLSALRGDRDRWAIAAGERSGRRWRVLVVFVDDTGHLSEAIYQEDVTPETVEHQVLGPLRADGYLAVRLPIGELRRVLAAAAERAARSARLPSAYYLGRDLFELGDAHLAGRPSPDVHATLLGRGIDLLAAGELARARPMLERCAHHRGDDPLAASSFGLCLLQLGDAAAAMAWLDRAAELEPGAALHHWNAASAAHRAGRMGGCYLSLRRYLDCLGAQPPTADDAEPARVDIARRFISDYERMARLDGVEPGARASAELPRRTRRRTAKPVRALPER